MRYIRRRAEGFLGAALLAALLSLSALASETGSSRHERERLAGPVPARVVHVVDGDTIVVRARIWLGQEVETSVRLVGADAPELRARCDAERRKAEEARDFLKARLDGKSVFLKDVLNDKYGGRVLAEVEDETGQNLSRLLLEKGLARPYGGGHRASWCE
jgi:endonuclease YncB( thermonuclease family)